MEAELFIRSNFVAITEELERLFVRSAVIGERPELTGGGRRPTGQAPRPTPATATTRAVTSRAQLHRRDVDNDCAPAGRVRPRLPSDVIDPRDDDSAPAAERVRPRLPSDVMDPRDVTDLRDASRSPTLCVFCRSNGESRDVYRSHRLRDVSGDVTCPVLYAYKCVLCGVSGPTAHTIKYCPRNAHVTPADRATHWLKTEHMSCGKRRRR